MIAFLVYVVLALPFGKGWVEAAMAARPYLLATSATVPRRRVSSSRPPDMDLHTPVATSIWDLRSSGLIRPPKRSSHSPSIFFGWINGKAAGLGIDQQVFFFDAKGEGWFFAGHLSHLCDGLKVLDPV
jgi:hypothetical protein